jgi:hypothetical protein
MISLRQANEFFAPLRQKSTIFIINGRETNISFARFLLGCICVTKKRVLILDMNAFYASNILLLNKKLTENCLGNTIITVPTDDSKLESWLISSTFSKNDLLIIDNLNTVYHLMSINGRRFNIRRLYAITSILSYLAQTNEISIFLTVYRTTSERVKNTPRSLDQMGETSISVKIHDSTINFQCNTGRAWINGTFSMKF